MTHYDKMYCALRPETAKEKRREAWEKMKEMRASVANPDITGSPDGSQDAFAAAMEADLAADPPPTASQPTVQLTPPVPQPTHVSPPCSPNATRTSPRRSPRTSPQVAPVVNEPVKKVLLDFITDHQDTKYTTAPEAHWHLTRSEMKYMMIAVSLLILLLLFLFSAILSIIFNSILLFVAVHPAGNPHGKGPARYLAQG
jgi:hypothetical protein